MHSTSDETNFMRADTYISPLVRPQYKCSPKSVERPRVIRSCYIFTISLLFFTPQTDGWERKVLRCALLYAPLATNQDGVSDELVILCLHLSDLRKTQVTRSGGLTTASVYEPQNI